MRKIFIAILAVSLNCSKVVEPVSFGEYFVTNATSTTIVLSASRIGGAEANLSVNAIPAGQKLLIFSFVEGSGGAVAPSNAFSSFTVYNEVVSPANIIYSKVDDADWIDEGVDADGHLLYHLTIN